MIWGCKRARGDGIYRLQRSCRDPAAGEHAEQQRTSDHDAGDPRLSTFSATGWTRIIDAEYPGRERNSCQACRAMRT